MRFSMMTVNGNCMFDTCKKFIVMNMESLVKLHGSGCSDDCIKEALYIFLNHVGNLYVCGLIDEEFFRTILGGMMEDDAIAELIAAANDIRKDIVRHEDSQKI